MIDKDDLAASKPHLDFDIVVELERYMTMRRDCSRYLKDHPRVAEFIAAMRSGEWEDAYDAGFTED